MYFHNFLLASSMLYTYTIGHTNRVTCIKIISEHEWILSTGRDKRLQWSCTQSGRGLGTYESTAWCLAVEYPHCIVVLY